MSNRPDSPNDIPNVPGSSRAWDIFMIIAFGVGIFYLVSFQLRYPDYWYAVALFLIIAVVGIIRRIASLVEGRTAAPVDGRADQQDGVVPASDEAGQQPGDARPAEQTRAPGTS